MHGRSLLVTAREIYRPCAALAQEQVLGISSVLASPIGGIQIAKVQEAKNLEASRRWPIGLLFRGRSVMVEVPMINTIETYLSGERLISLSIRLILAVIR
jgi:hypothetical protein